MRNETTNTAVPKLRFPEFREAGGWEESKLGEVSEIVRGGSPRPIEDFITTDPNGLNWLKIGDVAPEAKYIFKTQQKVIREALAKTREVSPGDLILSNSMSFGRPYIMKTKSCIHDGWIAISHISEDVLTDYLYYAISSESSQTYFVANAAGAAVLNLNAERIKVLPLTIPSIGEQQKIAATLSSLDDLLTAHSAKLAALQAHKRGLMQGLFPAEGETVPKLRFPEFLEAGEWEEKKLPTLVELISGLHLSPDEYGAQGDIPYFSGPSDFTNDLALVNKWTLQSTNIGRAGDTLITVKGSGAGGLFQLGIDEVALGRQLMAVRAISAHAGFIAYFLATQKQRLISLATGNLIPGLSRVDILGLNVLIPSLAEQQKVAATLTSLDNRITAQSQQIEALKLHKKGLMQGLFPAAAEPTA